MLKYFSFIILAKLFDVKYRMCETPVHVYDSDSEVVTSGIQIYDWMI